MLQVKTYLTDDIEHILWSSDENSVRQSVCPSVRLTNACILTKRKKDRLSRNT